MLLGLALVIALVRVVPWLASSEPCGAEPTLALIVVVLCCVGLIKNGVERYRNARRCRLESFRKASSEPDVR